MCGMHRFMLFPIFMAALWIIKPPTKTSSVRVRYNEWHRWFVFGSCLWIKVYTLIENKLTSFYIFMRNKALFIPLEEVCVCSVHKRAPALNVPKATRGSQMGWSSPDKKGNIWTSLCSVCGCTLLYLRNCWDLLFNVGSALVQSTLLQKSVTSVPWTPPMTSNTGLMDPSFP